MMENVTKIFINPKAHINPKFLNAKPTNIHYNPKFLIVSSSVNKEIDVLPQCPLNLFNSVPVPARVLQPAIKNTKNKLIRKPVAAVSSKPDQKISLSAPRTRSNVYKLDRRSEIIRKKQISRFSIRHLDQSASLTPKKVIINDKKLRKIGKSLSPTSSSFVKPVTSQNKKLVMVSINGVLYKSSTNKLQKSVPAPKKTISSGNPNERSLFVRGEKFTLDSTGTRLRRDSESYKLKLSRIDIGRLTYKVAQNGGFVRDNSHSIRTHLSSAKHKSINVLSSKLKLVNIICPIFRRLGKCSAHSNRRCPKTHDPKYVSLCPHYLKGNCTNVKCLLSHETTLSKMPVCKFFLEGLCNKDDCLYLHKKLSDDTKVCPEFAKGYCQIAEKCKLRHEFIEEKSTKTKINRKSKRREPPIKKTSKPAVPPENKVDSETAEKKRYYEEGSAEASNVNENIPKREKLGRLPSYIPL